MKDRDLPAPSTATTISERSPTMRILILPLTLLVILAAVASARADGIVPPIDERFAADQFPTSTRAASAFVARAARDVVVLVSFEVGYLMPPVALNQLLTRQVIGEEEVSAADAEVRHLGFFRRYERWILPLIVMASGLSLVAFGPLAVKDFEFLAPLANWLPHPQQ